MHLWIRFLLRPLSSGFLQLCAHSLLWLKPTSLSQNTDCCLPSSLTTVNSTYKSSMNPWGQPSLGPQLPWVFNAPPLPLTLVILFCILSLPVHLPHFGRRHCSCTHCTHLTACPYRLMEKWQMKRVHDKMHQQGIQGSCDPLANLQNALWVTTCVS